MSKLQLIDRSIHTLLMFSAALALSACAFPKVLGDNPQDSSTGTTGGTTSEPGVTDGPPVECDQITDEAACLAAGCSEFTTIVRTTVVDGECVAGEVAPLCMWFAGDAWGGTATPGAFYEIASGAATLFSTDWIEPPHGWADCGDPGAPPACACFSVCNQMQNQAAEFLDEDKPCADVSDCVIADAVCYEGNTCASVGVHKDSQAEWEGLHSGLEAPECCAGADPCGGNLACEDQRCVVTFP